MEIAPRLNDDIISKERKLLFKDSTLSFLRMVTTTISNYVILMLMVRGFGSEGYGTLVQFTVTSLFMVTIASLNLGHSMSRFIPAETDVKAISRIFTAILLCVMFSALIVSIIVYLLRYRINPLVFGTEYKEWLWVALLVYFLFTCVQCEVESLLRAMRFLKSLFIIDIAVALITVVSYALVIHYQPSLFWLIWTAVLVNCAKTVIFIIVQYSKGIFICRPDFGVLKPYLAFGTPLLFMGFGFMMVQYAGRYIINMNHGIAAVGAYSILYSFATLVVFFWNAGTSVFLPDLANLYDTNRKEELEYRFSKMLILGMAIMVPTVVGLSVIREQLFLLIGDSVLISETFTLQILCLAFIGYGVILAYSLLINLLKKSFWLGGVWIILAFVNIIANLLLVPKYGILGSSLGALICFGGGSLVVVLECHKYFKVHVPAPKILKIIISACAMFALLNSVHFYGKSGLVLEVVVGAIVYFGILLAMGFFEKNEVQYVSAAIREKIKVMVKCATT